MLQLTLQIRVLALSCSANSSTPYALNAAVSCAPLLINSGKHRIFIMSTVTIYDIAAIFEHVTALTDFAVENVSSWGWRWGFRSTWRVGSILKCPWAIRFPCQTDRLVQGVSFSCRKVSTLWSNHGVIGIYQKLYPLPIDILWPFCALER